MKNRFYNKNIEMDSTPLKDGKRDTIVQWIYDIHVVEWYSTYLTKKTLEDATLRDKIQEIYVMICEISQEKWDSIYEQGYYAVGAYVTGIIHQQLISKSSICYNKYDKFSDFNKTMNDDFWNNYEENN